MDPEERPRKPGIVMLFLWWFAGVDAPIMLQFPSEWDDAANIGALGLFNWLLECGLFSVVGHRLFAVPGQLRPELIAGAIFLASFTAAIDRLIVKSGFLAGGEGALRRGGVDITGGIFARTKVGVLGVARLVVGGLTAALLGIFISLMIFNQSVADQIAAVYRNANAALITVVTEQKDDEIKQAAADEAAQSQRVAGLADQIAGLRSGLVDPSTGNSELKSAQDAVDQLTAERAKTADELSGLQTFAADELFGQGANDPAHSHKPGDGPRHQAALAKAKLAQDRLAQIDADLAAAQARLDDVRKRAAGLAGETRQQDQEQLPGFEAALKSESAKLADLKDRLEKLRTDREAAIQTALEASPTYVAPDTSVVAELKALEFISEDPKVATVVWLVDAVATVYETAVLFGKGASYLSGGYGAMLARDNFARVVSLADDLNEMLGDGGFDGGGSDGGGSGGGGAGGPLDDNSPAGGSATALVPPLEADNDPFSDPPKRPRGRPRKSPPLN